MTSTCEKDVKTSSRGRGRGHLHVKNMSKFRRGGWAGSRDEVSSFSQTQIWSPYLTHTFSLTPFIPLSIALSLTHSHTHTHTRLTACPLDFLDLPLLLWQRFYVSTRDSPPLGVRPHSWKQQQNIWYLAFNTHPETTSWVTKGHLHCKILQD